MNNEKESVVEETQKDQESESLLYGPQEEDTVSIPVTPVEETKNHPETEKEKVSSVESQDTEEEKEVSPEKVLEDQLKEAEKRYEQMNDRYLRLNAEFENFKKRMAKESASRLKYNHMNLIKELLPAIDNLEHAINHAQKESSNVDAMREGLEIVYKQIQEAFSKFGVVRIESIGKKFDPNCHEAVGTVDSEEVPEDNVVDEFRAGYFLHDRIIRPSMVRVSKKQN